MPRRREPGSLQADVAATENVPRDATTRVAVIIRAPVSQTTRWQADGAPLFSNIGVLLPSGYVMQNRIVICHCALLLPYFVLYFGPADCRSFFQFGIPKGPLHANLMRAQCAKDAALGSASRQQCPRLRTAFMARRGCVARAPQHRRGQEPALPGSRPMSSIVL